MIIMPASFPDKFQVVSEQQAKKNFFPLHHNHLTTTDFFRLQPVVCRKVEPNDTMDVDCTSFVRLFPMPFPVFGRIRYYNRCFFVPYRQIMEGFNEFITDKQYSTDSGFVKIQSAPYFTNDALAGAFVARTSESTIWKALALQIDDKYYWRPLNDRIKVLVINNGSVAFFSDSGTTESTFMQVDGELFFHRNIDANGYYNEAVAKFGKIQAGYYLTITGEDPSTETVEITDNRYDESYEFVWNATVTPYGLVTFGEDFDSFWELLSQTPFDDVRFDFISTDVNLARTYWRFTNRGRLFYTILTSLGYRIDFSRSNDGTDYRNKTKYSAGKLLAYLKVFLDWYSPSAYSEVNALRMMFKGVSSSGRAFSTADLLDIADGLDFVTYERDYFTSAWQNPMGPNVESSPVTISDPTVVNSGSSYQNIRSQVRNTNTLSNVGSTNGTPTLSGERSRDPITQPSNISMYILDSLRALTNDTYRKQLAGNRVVDSYLAKYGVKLNDDRVNRCYYIGGYSYDADIMDIMSTADTQQAALGDYAGKGIAYSDAHRSFHFESDQEHGFIIVVSSVVPTVGYVQGVDKENKQLTRLQFVDGDFDNLGTQPITKDEIFADYGMPSPDGELKTPLVAPDAIHGFVPRYSEEKIGRDFLTGDFNVPSRREGMDAFHLFRLFNEAPFDSVHKGFLIGEQKQYDRIFNNTSDEYDHMYVEHHVYIKAYRNMKSINEVYDFEHSDGKTVEVDANGTQLS